MEKCYCTFCVEMRHGVQSDHDHDYSDNYDYDDSVADESGNYPQSYAPFMVTVEQYAVLESEYSYLIRSKNIYEISRDDKHVIGKLRTDSHSRAETHDYMVLQDITDLDLRGLQNAWFTTSGKILYVPWYGHNLTSALLGYADKGYADALENMGWFHYSIGSWRNRCNVKVTDRMYDAIAKFADQNNEDAALIAFGRK